ncbi:MAG: tRNA uridine-5-carboxymethylaminomethyl(34) synthesis enzyme MnmG [Sphaerobacter sp.]|nr:tRNA uridine-5-carboxymethylaminomethyl(34) synthesis enzyme MnmG [Sphaerobacter sp.]
MNAYTERFDVIVIGAGHAGCEAALAAARAGCTTLVLTPNLDRIGFMPCNPSIGGPAKGHLVREVDALGGEMAQAIDRTAIQIRLLNTSKGPAVQALRAQADKTLYPLAMKEALERQKRLTVRQEAVTDIELLPGGERPRVQAVRTDAGNRYLAGAVVVTAGTFLRGSMIAGTWRASGGRAGEPAAVALASSLRDVGIQLRRFKTGTPPRIDARTIDFSQTELQPGSAEPRWFSFDGAHGQIERLELPPLPIYPGVTDGWRVQMPCYQVHTNPETHRIIAENLDRAPMFNGAIEGVGPRYCPSIEDKVVRFRDKPSHGLFLEPEGWRTMEVYVQGANTSLPQDVQLAFLRTIPALANVAITRYGYAVEYDAIDTAELTVTMEARRVAGLFFAGQVCGTSGYEEAAGQGIVAGLNAACYTQGAEPLVLRRDQAYIGVMIDDLTTQAFSEPYRMLTSRAEYRLLLRADNAEARLSSIAYRYGLISRERWETVQRETRLIEQALAWLAAQHLPDNERTNAALRRAGLPPLTRHMTALEYLRRPEVRYVTLAPVLASLSGDDPDAWVVAPEVGVPACGRTRRTAPRGWRRPRSRPPARAGRSARPPDGRRPNRRVPSDSLHPPVLFGGAICLPRSGRSRARGPRGVVRGEALESGACHAGRRRGQEASLSSPARLRLGVLLLPARATLPAVQPACVSASIPRAGSGTCAGQQPVPRAVRRRAGGGRAPA